MTFEEAVDIVSIPPQLKESYIGIQYADGMRKHAKVYVKGNLALHLYQGQWHVIHVPTELAIISTPSYDEAMNFMHEIVDAKLDINWGYRELLAFKAIAQLIRKRRSFMTRNQPQEVGGGNTSVQQAPPSAQVTPHTLFPPPTLTDNSL